MYFFNPDYLYPKGLSPDVVYSESRLYPLGVLSVAYLTAPGLVQIPSACLRELSGVHFGGLRSPESVAAHRHISLRDKGELPTRLANLDFAWVFDADVRKLYIIPPLDTSPFRLYVVPIYSNGQIGSSVIHVQSVLTV